MPVISATFFDAIVALPPSGAHRARRRDALTPADYSLSLSARLCNVRSRAAVNGFFRDHRINRHIMSIERDCRAYLHCEGSRNERWPPGKTGDQTVVEAAAITEPFTACGEGNARQEDEVNARHICNWTLCTRFPDSPHTGLKVTVGISYEMQFKRARLAIDARQAKRFTVGKRMLDQCRSVKLAAEAHIRKHATRVAVLIQCQQFGSDVRAEGSPLVCRQCIARSDDFFAQGRFTNRFRRYFSSH